MEDITKRREPLPQLVGIYFISPTDSTVRQLVRDFSMVSMPQASVCVGGGGGGGRGGKGGGGRGGGGGGRVGCVWVDCGGHRCACAAGYPATGIAAAVHTLNGRRGRRGSEGRCPCQHIHRRVSALPPCRAAVQGGARLLLVAPLAAAAGSHPRVRAPRVAPAHAQGGSWVQGLAGREGGAARAGGRAGGWASVLRSSHKQVPRLPAHLLTPSAWPPLCQVNLHAFGRSSFASSRFCRSFSC